jgi:hypothetical protein
MSVFEGKEDMRYPPVDNIKSLVGK